MIRTHCLTVESVNDLEELKWEPPHKKFADQLSIFENMVNSDSKRKKFGSAEIYEGALIPTTQSFNHIPGSRGNDRQRAKARKKGLLFLEITGVNWAGTIEITLVKRIIS